MVSPVELGKRISDLRKARGYTQEELGTELSITGQAISKWEKGDSMPDVAILPDLANLLGISVDGLLSGSASIPDELIRSQIHAALHNQDYAARFKWIWELWALLFQTIGPVGTEGAPSKLNELNTALTYAGTAVLDIKGLGVILTSGYLADLYEAKPGEVSRFFSLMADEVNLRILLHFRPGLPKRAEELQKALAVPADKLPSHLLALSEAGLIAGTSNGYKLSESGGVLVYVALSVASEYVSKGGHSAFFNWDS